MVIGRELLGILGQAVPAVAEGRGVIVASDARIHENPVNDFLLLSWISAIRQPAPIA